MANSIAVIFPYRYQGAWVFDDEAVGLVKEPFIAGTDVAIDRAIAAKDIPDAECGFRLIFSAGPFPGYDFRLAWLRDGDGGYWYHSDDFQLDCWLCPALLKYFEIAPREIFVQLDPS
jgi:hypothetical protein